MEDVKNEDMLEPINGEGPKNLESFKEIMEALKKDNNVDKDNIPV